MRRQLGLAIAVLVGACKGQAPAPTKVTGVRAKVEAEQRATRLPVKGVRRLAGAVQELRPSADGRLLTVLVNGEKPTVEGVPPTMRVGELWALPTEGGEPARVAAGVTNLPGGWLMSPDSRWIAAMADWDVAQQRGVLLLADSNDLHAEPVRVAGKASYAVWDDAGKQLAWIEGGVLSVGSAPRGPWRPIAAEVSTAEFSPDGRSLYFRRRYAAAGGLYEVDLARARPEPRRLIDQVADFIVHRERPLVVATARALPSDRVFQLHVFEGPKLTARKLADDALRFRVSKDGRFLAWRASSHKGDQVDIGELWLAEVSRGAPRRLGLRVKDFEFSPDGTRLVFRENYQELPLGGREALQGDARLEKVGDLSVVDLPAGAPRLLQRLCPNFLFAPDGHALAYTARIEQPEVTRRLFLWRFEGQPVALQDWLYEYQFRPSSGELYFRANCTREGRSCEVLATGAADEKPRRVASDVYGVRFAADGSRALLAAAHLTDDSFDIQVRDLTSGEATPIDQYVEWPALVLGAHGEQIAYLVHEKQRPGLYVAATR